MRLPPPPSVNALFSNTNNVKKPRVKSKEYLAWIKHAGQVLALEKLPMHAGSVHIIIRPARVDNRDADGFVKPILDLLVRHGIIADDKMRFVESVLSRWHDEDHGDTHVLITPAVERPEPKPVVKRPPRPPSMAQLRPARPQERLTVAQYRKLVR